MIKIKRIVKKLYFNLKTKIKGCDNHEYETITNLYGDCINFYSHGKKTVRSIRKCKHCGKTMYSQYIDPECDIVNFNLRFKRYEGGKK